MDDYNFEAAMNDIKDLQADYAAAQAKLEEAKADLQKKSDLCTMYEHALQVREDKINQLEAENKDCTKEIADLRTTIDTLSIRIAKLKDDIQRK